MHTLKLNTGTCSIPGKIVVQKSNKHQFSQANKPKSKDQIF
jgi:hypothetical protein